MRTIRKISIGALVIFTSLTLINATVWEGTAATAAAGALPQEGLYAATNSFPLNTVVDVTNLENGKTVRVVVRDVLDSPGFLIVLSQEASAQIDLPAKSMGRVRMSQSADALALSTFADSSSTADPDHDPLAALADAAEHLSTGENNTPFALEEGDAALSGPPDKDLCAPSTGDDSEIVDVPELAAADAGFEATIDKTPVEPVVSGADDEAKGPEPDLAQADDEKREPTVIETSKGDAVLAQAPESTPPPEPAETLAEESAVTPPSAAGTKPSTPAGQTFDALSIPKDFNWDDYDITLTPTAERPPTLSTPAITGNDLYPLAAPIPGKSEASVSVRTPTAIDMLPVVPPIPQKPAAPAPVPEPTKNDLKPVTATVPQKPATPAPVPEPTKNDLKPVTAQVPQKPATPTPVPEPTKNDLKPLITPIPDAAKEENAASQALVPPQAKPVEEKTPPASDEAALAAGSRTTPIPARSNSTAPETPQTAAPQPVPVQEPAAEKPVFVAPQKTEDELNAEAMAKIASAPRVASIPPRVNQPAAVKPAPVVPRKTEGELNAEAMAKIASAPHVASIPSRVNQPAAVKPAPVPEIPEPVSGPQSSSRSRNIDPLPVKNVPAVIQPASTPQIAKAEPLKEKLYDALNAMERGQPQDTVELRSLLEAFNRSLEMEQALKGTVAQPLAVTASTPERTAAKAPVFSVPSIDKLEKGKYYVQLGAFSQPAAVEKELTRLGISYPRRVQPAGTPDKPVYRVLVGPCSLGESNALLQRFKGLGYKDAFVKSGI
ncbi:SPOR domain-containing protein [Breznakiellaceae bacterium SP9]